MEDTQIVKYNSQQLKTKQHIDECLQRITKSKARYQTQCKIKKFLLDARDNNANLLKHLYTVISKNIFWIHLSRDSFKKKQAITKEISNHATITAKDNDQAIKKIVKKQRSKSKKLLEGKKSRYRVAFLKFFCIKYENFDTAIGRICQAMLQRKKIPQNEKGSGVSYHSYKTSIKLLNSKTMRTSLRKM